MDTTSNFEHMSLEDLRQGCERDDALRNTKRDARPNEKPPEVDHCLELFRRAIRAGDQQAWTLFFNQFQGQMDVWVQGHPAYTPDLEEPLFFTSLAFEKFWQRLSPERLDKFPTFASVQRYLQMCVHSVLCQNRRGRQKTHLLDEYTSPVSDREALSASAVPPIPVPAGQGVELDAFVETQAENLWELLQPRLHDKQERILVYARFVLALSPVGILHQFPGLYASTGELNDALGRLLSRLSQDGELRNFLDLDEVDASLEDQLTGTLYRIFCPVCVELGELELDVLPERNVKPVRKHLAECPLCSNEQGWLQSYLQALESTY